MRGRGRGIRPAAPSRPRTAQRPTASRGRRPGGGGPTGTATSRWRCAPMRSPAAAPRRAVRTAAATRQRGRRGSASTQLPLPAATSPRRSPPGSRRLRRGRDRTAVRLASQRRQGAVELPGNPPDPLGHPLQDELLHDRARKQVRTRWPGLMSSVADGSTYSAPVVETGSSFHSSRITNATSSPLS